MNLYPAVGGKQSASQWEEQDRCHSQLSRDPERDRELPTALYRVHDSSGDTRNAWRHGDVSYEPFTIRVFFRWAVRLLLRSQEGRVLPFPSCMMGSYCVLRFSELSDVLASSVPIFLKDLPNKGESKICRFGKQESRAGRQSVLDKQMKSSGRTERQEE